VVPRGRQEGAQAAHDLRDSAHVPVRERGERERGEGERGTGGRREGRREREQVGGTEGS
jgi:hypothetical protein